MKSEKKENENENENEKMKMKMKWNENEKIKKKMKGKEKKIKWINAHRGAQDAEEVPQKLYIQTPDRPPLAAVMLLI